MSKESKIEWCDSTINWWRGCTKVSTGCAHCYAEKNIGVKLNGIKWGKGQPRVKTKGAVADALAMNRKPWICDECGHATANGVDEPAHKCHFGPAVHQSFHRRRIFSLSLGDWLDAEVPIEWLAEMLDTIRQCDQVIWILCTKRPELWRESMKHVREFATQQDNFELHSFVHRWLERADFPPPQNIWLLTSVEEQKAADERIPELLKIPAVVRGLSCEPLLGPVDLSTSEKGDCIAPVDWLIIGGESGTDARPCATDWIRSLMMQGKAAGAATFVKQIGRNPEWNDAEMDARFYERLSHPKGGDINEWPADLRVREFPQ